MALAVTITKLILDGVQARVSFNLAASGSYVTGGDVVDFTKATADVAFIGSAAVIPTDQGPLNFDVWDSGGNLANGVSPVMGTTMANSKVKFTSAFNTELSAGAYPAAITGTKLQGEAVFNKYL